LVTICLEIKTECKHCGGSLVINALTNEILCPACQKINEFTYGSWKQSILESALKDYLELNEGEGQNQTVMTGEYTFHIMYGNQKPRCGKCKTSFKPERYDEYAKQGKAVCEKCSNVISVRLLPEILKNDFEIKYLIGEDSDMFSSGKGTMKTPDEVKPILFTCPSCAGNLKIDGSDRVVTCNFCNSQIYLPDDLWFRLHPVKVVERWYAVLDEKKMPERPIEWDHMSDAAVDTKGNLYIASADDNEHFMLWSMGPDFKTRWRVSDLEYSYEYSRLALANDENLYLWDKDKHSLLVVSTKDGSTLNKISGRDASELDPEPFNLKGADSLTVDTDGTLLVLKEKCILRFSADGKRVPTWGAADEPIKKRGFFSRLFGGESINPNEDEYPPDVAELKNKPMRIDTGSTFAARGYDGFIYFMEDTSSEDASVAKYDRDGNRLWREAVPEGQKYCRPYIDRNGNVYVLETVSDDNVNLLKLDAGTMKWETLLKDIKEGGKLNESDKLVLSAEGRIYCFNNYNGMRVFDSNLNMIYISQQSKEDDEETLSEKKEKVEKDEEIK
jgi:hypothetical protein